MLLVLMFTYALVRLAGRIYAGAIVRTAPSGQAPRGVAWRGVADTSPGTDEAGNDPNDQGADVRRHHLNPKLAVALAFVTVLGACSGSSPTPTAAGDRPNASSTPPSSAATPRTSAAAGPAIAATGDPTSAAGAIEIASLRRDSPRLVTLRFALVNSGTKDVTVANRFGGNGSRAMTDVALVDPDGLKKYLTVLDEKDQCLCSTNLSNVPAGQRLDLFATFAAPPAEVKAVTVIVPSFQPLNGIPLS